MRAELLIARSMARERTLPHIQLPIAMERYHELAHRYFAKTNAKKIVMENEEGNFYVIDYVTRFSQRYTKLIRKRFASYYPSLHNYRHSKSLFLTLTVDPKHCLSLQHARLLLNHSFSLITNWVRRAFRAKTRMPSPRKPRRTPLLTLINSISFSSLTLNPIFIKTFEFQQTGMIHLHALLINVGYLPQQLLHIANDGRNRIEVIKHGLRAGIRYVYKYIIKHHKFGEKYDERVSVINDHTVLAWALGLRTFSISLSNKGISHQDHNGVVSDPGKGDESGDRTGNPLSKPTYHKLMVVGILSADTVGYYERGQLIGVLSELIESSGGSNSEKE